MAVKEPTNGWQTMDSCPRVHYEEYLVLVSTGEGRRGLLHRIAMWDPDHDEFVVFHANWDPEPVYWQHLPPVPGETLKSDEERQRLFEEEMERHFPTDSPFPPVPFSD